MASEQKSIEVHGETVESAIKDGLQQLGVDEENVEIEVLEKGGRGLFGLGSRQALIKLTLKQESLQEPVSAAEEKIEPAPAEAASPKLSADEDHDLQVSRVVVEALIEKMKVHARIKARYLEPDEISGEKTIFIEILGNDLSILIGRRSETLNAIQYISSLIISRELNKWVPILIDVQGYRERRERQLKLLAKRMAEQAVATGRRQVLEPMPANERRIIHIELREHPDIETSSIGEEPNRKVTVYLKNK